MKMNQIRKNAGLSVAIIMIVAGILVSGCATIGGVAKNPLIGSWTLTVDWGKGVGAEQVLVVNADLTGTLTFAQMDTATDLSNVTSEGDAVGFSVALGKGGQEIEIAFEGTISGDSLEGAFTTQRGSFPVTGVRN